MNRRRDVITALLACLLGAPALGAQDSAATRRRTVYEDLQMFSQALNQIRVNHPDSVDTHELFMAAIEGMVRAADPHSYVILARPDASEREKQLTEGKIHPVPLEFEYYGGAAVVVSVAPGTDAARLDILPGDELVAADGQPVVANSAEELTLELAGSKNSTVRLTFERLRLDGSLATVERAVKRERAEDLSAVPAALMLNPGTGYVRITTFANPKVADEVRDALSRLENQNMERLVLDLRGNGGGSIAQAAAVAGEFLPTGAVVYTAYGRKAEVNDTVRVKRSFWRREKRYPLVVLVDEGTASAAELLAGALQDHDRALIVGEPTFGKSLITRGFPLVDGSAIVLVIGRLRTPCGRVIQRAYRDLSTRQYYRMAAAARDTAGLPSCRTASGRVAYGGGGIVPDLALPRAAASPPWLAQLYEADLPLQWIGAYVAERRDALGTADTFSPDRALPATALTSFRAFAADRGVVIPATPEAGDQLQRSLAGQVAAVAFGREGYYRVLARLDGRVMAAARAFDRAEAILAQAR